MKRYLLHNEIYTDLVQRIKTGNWKPGDCLPTEIELQRMYGVSRTPVRQAMEQLRHQGFIVRQAGRGTYVASPGDRASNAWRHLTGFAPHYVESFNQVSAVLLEMQTKTAPGEAVDHLQISESQQVLSLERLRLVGGEPVAYLNHYLAPAVESVKPLILEQPSFHSMAVFLQQLGFYVSEVKEQIWAVACPPKAASWLQVAPGHPVFLLHRRSFDLGHRPVEFVSYYVRSELWQYHTQFTR